MSENSSTNLKLNESASKNNTWLLDIKEYITKKLMDTDIWTRLAIGTTFLEFSFSKVPLISIPNAILDVGGGLGNLFQKINSEEVKPSDIMGFGNSLVTFIGTFSITASLGIEASQIGVKLIRISKLTTPISLGLFTLGYILDHHEEIKEYVTGPGYDLLKEQYTVALNKFEETKGALKAHFGEKLFDTVTSLNSEEINQIFTFESNGKLAYNFDYLDPTGSLNLKEKLDISPSDLYHQLNELNTEFNAELLSNLELASDINNPIDITANSFPENIETIPSIGTTQVAETEPVPQDLFLSVDMSHTNLELIHLTKEDLRSSPLYSVTHDIWTVYRNDNLPWLHENVRILEVKDKFFLYNHYGTNRGLTFPLFYDKTTKLPIGLPLDNKGDFIEQDSLDVLKDSPNLFNEPGHISNNMALAVYQMQHAAVAASFKHVNLGMNAVQDRLDELKTLNIEEIIKLKNGALESFNLNLDDHEQGKANFSPASGNSREGKYCFPFYDIDTTEIEETLGTHQKINVEICFDKNPYVFE